MKRSDALKQLVDLLPNLLAEYADSAGYADANEFKRLQWLAEDILSRIESYDLMVPPSTIYWNTDENGKLQYSMHNGDYMNVWEKEE